MTYEEYKERMARQGRRIVTPETYDAYIEPAYMATEMDKDDFCELPDRAIDALGSQARAVRDLKAEIRKLNAEAKAAKDSAQRLGDELEAVRTTLAETYAELEDAAQRADKNDLRATRLEQLLKNALAKWPTSALVDEIIKMAAGTAEG